MSDTKRYVKKPKVAKVKVPTSEAAQRPIEATGTGHYTVGELNKIERRKATERRATNSPGAAGRQPQRRQGAAKVTVPTLSISDIKAPKTATAPKPSASPKIATVVSSAKRKKANQAARMAIRTSDPKAAKRALAGLPTGTKKHKKYAPKLEGIIKAGSGSKPSATPKLKIPTAPKAEAPTAAPKVNKKLKRQLARARATNKKLQAGAPKPTTPEATKTAVHKVAPVQQPEPQAPAPRADTRSVADQLEAARSENVELKGVKGVKVPTTTDTSTADTTKASASKKFHRARQAGFKKRQDVSIRAKGIQTIPVRDTAAEMAETPEAATVRTRKIESDLLTAKAQESTAQPKPKLTAGEGDRRTSTEIFGKEAVARATEKIAEAPRTDLTLTAAHKGAPRYGVNLAEEDRGARAKAADEIRAASSKVRNVAISRGATPEILESLDRATESQHSRALDSYFDDVEAEKRPMSQAGPRKGDAPRRILTPTIDANAELTVARTHAEPPAPSDRTTIQGKIDLIKERAKPGGSAIYKGPEAIAALENLRDHGEVSTGAEPRGARVLPPGKDLVAEHFSKTRPSVRAARREGARAGVGRRPADIPKLTTPGTVPAGPTTPPATPAREHARVDVPVKSQAQLWAKRMADWARTPFNKPKKLTSPAIGSNVGANINKSSLARGGVVGATLLAGLVAAETAKAAKEAPAGQKLKVAKKTAKQEGTHTAATVGALSIGLAAMKKVSPVLGKIGTTALNIAALPSIAATGFQIGSVAGKEVAQIKEARRKSARDKAYSEQYYGTVEKATKTRHAKEAFKRARAKAKKEKK